jgi:DNA polymerase-4
MKRYRQISDRIFAIYQRFTPLVEPLSLDEAFLDVTGSNKLFGSAEDIAAQIKKLVFQETGLKVSAGVACSKLVAKIASDLNKPDGLTIVPPGQEEIFLAPLPIKRLWGVGRKTQGELNLLGVRTIGDIVNIPPDLLEKKFGKHGKGLYYKARGIDARDVDTISERKSVGHEYTFDTDLVDEKIINKELLDLADQVAKRLRRKELHGRTITLKVKYHDFQQITRSKTIGNETSDSKKIIHEVLRLLQKTAVGNKPIRLLGISVANLKPIDGAMQPSLFKEEGGTQKRQKVNKAVDAINEKFGATAILPGTLLGND